MTTETIVNVSWRPGGSEPQMVNRNSDPVAGDWDYECPKCGATFASATMYALHVMFCKGDKVELTEVKVNGLELSIFPWEDPAVVLAEAEAAIAEKEAPLAWWPWSDPEPEPTPLPSDDDPNEGEPFQDDSLDQWDNLPAPLDEPEDDYEGSLGFDVFLAEYRATHIGRELTPAEQARFNAGWDAFFMGYLPERMADHIRFAGYEAARKQFEEDVAAEHQLFAQTVNRGAVWGG